MLLMRSSSMFFIQSDACGGCWWIFYPQYYSPDAKWVTSASLTCLALSYTVLISGDEDDDDDHGDVDVDVHDEDYEEEDMHDNDDNADADLWPSLSYKFVWSQMRN